MEASPTLGDIAGPAARHDLTACPGRRARQVTVAEAASRFPFLASGSTEKEWRIMSALARWCYQHRFVVITAWIGLLIGLAVVSQAVKTSR